MKAFILTESSSSLGLGHLVRCTALAYAFNKMGISTKIIVKGGLKPPSGIRANNLFTFDWINSLDNIIKRGNKPDIIVVDSYLASQNVYQKIASIPRLTVYIDDYNRLNYPDGIVINGTVDAEKIRYPKSTSKKYLLGEKYIIIRDEFQKQKAKKNPDEIDSILLLSGGTNQKEIAPKMLKYIENYFPYAKKEVVINKFIKASQLRDMMYHSDFAVSTAGQTLNELAATGTPTIAIGVADNQAFNLKGYHQAKFIKNIIWWNDNNFKKKFIDSLHDIKDKESRKRKSVIGKKLVDSQGASRIVKYILSRIT